MIHHLRLILGLGTLRSRFHECDTRKVGGTDTSQTDLTLLEEGKDSWGGVKIRRRVDSEGYKEVVY